MMKRGYWIISTSILKNFFDGLILLVVGFVFFKISLNYSLILWAFVLGFVLAVIWIMYYRSLQLNNVGEFVPVLYSTEILLTFLGSVILFNESTNYVNYIGILLILAGIYLIKSIKLKVSLANIPKATTLPILLLAILQAIYALLAKWLLTDFKPLELAVYMYLSTAFILLVYSILHKKEKTTSISKIKQTIPRVFVAAVFGATGTFLLYNALSIGEASEIYPMAGVESVFVFIIASVFLKEKFYLHKFFGVMMVVLGVYFISV
jgi:uncharacterized membrane protein